MLWPRLVRQRGQHHLPRERELALLYPHLPIELVLPKCIVLASQSITLALADVLGRRNRRHLRLGCSPTEQVDEWQLNSVLLFQFLRELSDGRWRVRRRKIFR